MAYDSQKKAKFDLIQQRLIAMGLVVASEPDKVMTDNEMSKEEMVQLERDTYVSKDHCCEMYGCHSVLYSEDLCFLHYIQKEESKLKCIAIDCFSRQFSSGYCKKHYKNFVISGDPLHKYKMCTITNCKKRLFKEELCSKHYNAKYK